jgi:hypothetical protein
MKYSSVTDIFFSMLPQHSTALCSPQIRFSLHVMDPEHDAHLKLAKQSNGHTDNGMQQYSLSIYGQRSFC